MKHPTDSGNSNFGRYKTTSGKSTTNAMVKRNTPYKGSDLTTARPNPTPTYLDATNKDKPYGGVIKPKTKVVIRTTPICRGLIFPISVNLLMMGMKMMMAGTASIKSPTIINNTTRENMIIGPLVPAILVM